MLQFQVKSYFTNLLDVVSTYVVTFMSLVDVVLMLRVTFLIVLDVVVMLKVTSTRELGQSKF